MTTLQAVELGVLGPLQVRQNGALVTIPGAKPRAILAMLGLHAGSVVSADTLVELLWSEDPPRTAAKALQTHISALRRTLGDGVVVTEGSGWRLAGAEIDAVRYKSAAQRGRAAAAAGDTSQAVARFEEALALWRGVPELPDSRPGASVKTRWREGHAALVEDRADALLATGRAAEIIGELETAVADAPLRERRWGQLMLALYRAGRQGEALGAYQRARTLLAEELGVDPGPELRRLEAAIVAQDSALEVPAAQTVSAVTRAVTFLLTDIEGSTAAWEADAQAMAIALARHDELVELVVTSRGGRLIKTRGEGDATFSVFDRPSAAAAAAVEMQEAIACEPWILKDPMRIRVALHTGEAEFRDGDYFGRAVNRAARLRSLAEGGQIVCSGATAELVIDSLADDVMLVDLGTRQLRNLARPEHVFELRLLTAGDRHDPVSPDAPLERPGLPAVLAGPGPFVGRGSELEHLHSAWQTTLAGATNAVLIAGEPGVGKTRLAGEWSRQVYDQGAVVLYGRCDEDLGAPYQPFAEALRSLIPCLGASRLRGLRGVEALLPLVPGLIDLLPDLAAPTRADPDTERYALFDAVVALLGLASASAPVVLVLDDLHWAAKPTLLLLRHLLRFGEHARLQIVGTYRSTDLDRSHPLAAMLADLHRDGTAHRLNLSGLDEDEVSAYVAEAGYDDEELGRALASVTGGNPFFLIEALRHVDESGGQWDQSSLPQGVREAVSRRLSRLAPETNKALGAAAVVGSRFALDLVERVVGDDLIDAFDEACKAGIVIEEPGGRYRFNHALVRQSLLAELPSVRRMRLHQRIATTLENQPGADDELLAELAHHYFECAWAGNAGKAVEYCRRAADQAMARLAYEGAADLYDRAVHALEELDDEVPDRADQAAELLIARCEALLAAGDATTAVGAVAHLQSVTVDSERLAAWATCFDGQLSMLTHPERLDEVEAGLAAAAARLAELGDAAGEAKAHTVRAGCLARLGRIGDCEIALDDALSAARRAGEHRRVNAVLAGAPLAALWGPNPVPRAGGRCLDVIRLLRITTDSPAVEVTSTRCQAVLEAFRGRDAAARRMIDSARRMVTESGLRHTLLEVEQFAGIVELVADDPGAAEPCLRKAYSGFRRLGLDADVAETAALLGRTCLALDRDAEAAELCSESERLAGDALKASIAWRTLRAQLLSRAGDHAEARGVAEAAVALAERTDGLVDHGDACVALAVVLGEAGDVAGQKAAAERAIELYERKGAVALAEKARLKVGAAPVRQPLQPEATPTNPSNSSAHAGLCLRLIDAVNREAWDEVGRLLAPHVSIESRRKIVGFPPKCISSSEWREDMRRYLEAGLVHYQASIVAVRGERLALFHFRVGTVDRSSGAPQDEMLQVVGSDAAGLLALEIHFDLEDVDAALAELDVLHARLEAQHRQPGKLDNAATQVTTRFLQYQAAGDWSAIAQIYADDISTDDRRRVVTAGVLEGREINLASWRAVPEIETACLTSTPIATRGERLALSRVNSPATQTEVLSINEVDGDDKVRAVVVFDTDDLDAAFAELDRRYVAGEGAAYAHTWSVVTAGISALNQHELPSARTDWVNVDHRRVTPIEQGEEPGILGASWNSGSELTNFIVTVHRLNERGAVVTWMARETLQHGFVAEWRLVILWTIQGDQLERSESFDEEDLDAAIERFDQLTGPAPQLENAASRIYERFFGCFAARDWDAMAAMYAEDCVTDDRRRMVAGRVIRGREANTDNMRAVADLATDDLMATAIAVRGERLALSRVHSAEFETEVLNVVEIDAERQISAVIAFDTDDLDAAFAELDARYLAGEATAHARSWSVVTRAFAALNRRELPATTLDWMNVDHRRGTSIPSGEIKALLGAAWDSTTNLKNFVVTVHRLNDLGAVVTHIAHETSQDGFRAEWRVVSVMTIQGDLIDRCEVFDEADLDAAIARFEQVSQPRAQVQNTASLVIARCLAYFAARDWAAMAALFAEDSLTDDRRPVVGVGPRHGRDVIIADWRAVADVGAKTVTPTVVAIRGDRLVLLRLRFAGRDRQADAFHSDVLGVVEVDSDHRIAACMMWDSDAFEAAMVELDTRYIAGEAASHARLWQAVAEMYAAINNREIPETTNNFVGLDHRRLAAIGGPGDLKAYLAAALHDSTDSRLYVETVHNLTDLGAVVTHVAVGTSGLGFSADWRIAGVCTVEGDLVNRYEIFDESDLEAALARFEELSRPAPRLENTASHAIERCLDHFATRNWTATAEDFTDDSLTDDRRRVVGVGQRDGRAVLARDLRTAGDVGFTISMASVLAIRGEHLVLALVRAAGPDAETVQGDALNVVEVDADGRVKTVVVYDPDDMGPALAELDARYVAGEAAPYADVWSIIAGSYAALSRREPPMTAPDAVYIDHRAETAFGPADLSEYFRAGLRLDPGIDVFVADVHRHSDSGAVITYAAHETSREGFDAEWRGVALLTVAHGMVDRCEVFNEMDLDTAVARFEQLSGPALRLENRAIRVYARNLSFFAMRDWDSAAANVSDDYLGIDRRRVVKGEAQHGRAAVIAELKAGAEIGFTISMVSAVAIRGDRLVLARVRGAGPDPETVQAEILNLVEIDASDRVNGSVLYDLDDLDIALAELEARYAAGEAAPYADTWLAVAGAYAAVGRNELPAMKPDAVTIDHRLAASFAPGELNEYLRAGFDLGQYLNPYVEKVHRLNALGAVITHATKGRSQDGFEAEWRGVNISLVEGNRISRSELFDEVDLDAALERFDALQSEVRQLGNPASHAADRYLQRVLARDWDAFEEVLAADYHTDDRRRLVGGRILDRDAEIASVRAQVDLGVTHVVSTVVAVRGERLALTHLRYSGDSEGVETFVAEMLVVFDFNSEVKCVAAVAFDLDDLDAAIAELDARYCAGEAASHAATWSVIAGAYASMVRNEFPPMAADFAAVDHRRSRSRFASGEFNEFIRAGFELGQHLRPYVEVVHSLNDLGAVVTYFANGNSRDGFEAEWRDVTISLVQGNLVSRCEMFDESDLEVALARFDQLCSSTRGVHNQASQVYERFFRCFSARDWAAMAAMFAEDTFTDDRRRVVGTGILRGRDANIANMLAVADLATDYLTSTAIAARGDRLALCRVESPAFQTEVLNLVEIGADRLIVAVIAFDPDDIDAATAELDARYCAGEAAPYAATWSAVVGAYAAFNRHELPPTTADWVDVDHRRVATIAPGDLAANIRATGEVAARIHRSIETVHRLNNLGAVVTHMGYGTSREGFEAEWRLVALVTYKRGLLSRAELFDETDLEVALGRFDELSQSPPQLENAASHIDSRSWECFAARDWSALADLVTDDVLIDDRRRVVNAGVRHGRDDHIADMRSIAEVGAANTTSTVIATRGEHLALTHVRSSNLGLESKEISAASLCLVEVDADNRIMARTGFDPDDIDAAFAELESRYLAGEAAPYAATWSVIVADYAALNGGELPPTTRDWVNIDHRRGAAFGEGEMTAYIRASMDLKYDVRMHIETVHRLSRGAALFTHIANGTSADGFEAEWREIHLLAIEGNRISRCELFDEADLDYALARFDELPRPQVRLKNLDGN